MKISAYKPALSVKKVFTSSKLNLIIWRPIPPQGYVSLGDFATTQTGTLPNQIMCLPQSFTRKAIAGIKIFSSSRGGGDTKPFPVSIWTIFGNSGSFRGSPSAHQNIMTLPEGCEVAGVEEFYELCIDTEGWITGEWRDEFDVLEKPSLTWTKLLIEGLINSATTRQYLLKSTVFSDLIKYLRNDFSPSALTLIPSIISIIRASTSELLESSMKDLVFLCREILKKAVNVKVELAKKAISNGIFSLVDLVIEIQRFEVNLSKV
jgi:hypothetical protein